MYIILKSLSGYFLKNIFSKLQWGIISFGLNFQFGKMFRTRYQHNIHIKAI